MRFVVVVLFLVIVGACGLVSFVAANGLASLGNRALGYMVEEPDTPANAEDKRQVLFTVQPGQSATEIGEALAKEGLVRNPNAFRSAVRSRGAESRIAAGEYDLSPSMKPSEIVAILAEGREATIPLTIPEGRRIAEVADIVAARTPITREAFLTAANPVGWSYDFLTEQPLETLEGYLYPDTYRLKRNASARDLVQLMLDNFGKRVTAEQRARAEAEGLTFHQALTLASIVEREAVVPEERPRIAGVYLNRLRDEMRLQADPTVQFALVGPRVDVTAPPAGYWKKDLTEEDLQVASPYNTYRRAGLPPGPICNPGLPSIQAVLSAERHEFRYFVAREDGSHAFARTLEEHNANVARYQR